MQYDLLLRNGHIFDPGAGIDRHGNVAVRRTSIESIEAENQCSATTEINVEGCWVVPGLIDVHTHCFWRGNYIGMPADLAGIPSGVTAAIDAGSSGVSNYRALLRLLDQNETRYRIMLHLSAGGQIMSSQFPENIDPSVWNDDLFERAFAEYGSHIVGLKMRVSRSVLGSLGLEPFRRGLEMAGRLGARLFIHPTDPLAPMGDLAAMLRPGDVMCHMYHGFGHTIMENGEIVPAVQEARARGVLFDVSQGQGNFSLDLARAAIGQGFLPDTISTDLNYANWNHPYVFSLPMVMTKHLALGMEFADVVRCVTSNAASQFGRPGELGTLREGSPADITVFKLVEHPVTYRDIHGGTLQGNSLIQPMLTIINGQILYRSPFTL